MSRDWPPECINTPGHASSSSSFFSFSGSWDIFKAIFLLPLLGLNRGRKGGKRGGLRQHASWRHIDSWHVGTRIRTEPNRMNRTRDTWRRGGTSTHARAPAALTRRGGRGEHIGGQHQAGGPYSTGWKGSIHDWRTTLAQDITRLRTGWWETIFGNHSMHSRWYLCLWGMRLTPGEPKPKPR